MRGGETMNKRILGAITGLTLVLSLCAGGTFGQGAPGGQGQRGQGRGGGGQGGAPLRDLVPPGVDGIFALSADNSIIAHDPPVDDPNAPPRVTVKGQWLD